MTGPQVTGSRPAASVDPGAVGPSRARSARPDPPVVSPELDAVLFDMDGVVTDTAIVHALAWKRLFDDFLSTPSTDAPASAGPGADPGWARPFDLDEDYCRYVDGKPRYDGVESFLTSRSITLPYGHDDDPPSARTVCGLGNRKDGYVRTWLAENKVRAYPGTMLFIERLHAAGIRTAVFSSSRNAEGVLTSAGVIDLFDVRVDGTDLSRLGIPGKPHPAMLWETASQVGVEPGRAAVVEDATSGVQAGRDGGFAFVIGIDRGTCYGSSDVDACRGRLLAAGASIVIADLGAVEVTGRRLVVHPAREPGGSAR